MAKAPAKDSKDGEKRGGEERARDTRPLAEQIADDAAENTLALNPLVGLRTQDIAAATGSVLKALASQPQALAEQWLAFASEFGKIVTGQSEITADPKDRRFADPAWKSSSLHKAVMQSYVAWSKSVTELVAKTDLPEKDAARARLITSIFVDTMAPSNNPALNPTAIKTLVDTGGKSAVSGLKNFLDDMTRNGGLPSSVDASKFKVGENLANTPGTVVFKNDVLELVHYTAATEKVHQRPLLVVPPQINKYYSVDLSPDKSMIRFLLSHGIQPYCVSWRNPTPEQRDWGLDTYIAALDEACDAAREITGCDTVNIMGSCSGGITLSTYVAWLAAQKKEKINAVILAVCVLNTQAETDSDFSALVTPETIMAAKQMSKARGILDGHEMAKMFAWMRPNDLIWNYWVNNYLLGNAPPAFDVLYWNADTTRLPARLHGDFLDLIFTNPFMNPGKMSIHGVPIDMGKVKHDTYVIGGTTDHITPWKAVYQTARLYGDNTTFILSNSGHLQSLLNPPGNPKAWYVKGKTKEKDADTWTGKAEKHEGSWWLDWASYLKERSGAEVAAPKAPGSVKHKPMGSAPGTYVFEP
ncbi:class II poly(R)-hydroxyalkanoic acid synthase [Mesorhizobium loti]|nr:alpha/beta fold hydrolase [Mesorhizobium loti]PLP60874.1 class II poly(R)-hydroxyalkanoic acid synthase [Mesorhizobium loti]